MVSALIADKAQAALEAYKTGDITQIQALTADRSKIVMHKNSRQPGYVSAWFNVMASNNATGKSEQIDVYMPLLGIDAVAMAQRTINAAYKGCYVVVSAQMQENTPF